MKLPVIYSCLINDYSNIQEPPKSLQKKFNFFLFTDSKVKFNGWTNIIIEIDKSISQRRMAKKPKTQPWNFFESDYSVWIDANMELNEDIFIKTFEEFKNSKKSLGIFEHSSRNNILDEIDEVKKRLKDDPVLLDSQKDEYQSNFGDLTKISLYQGGFIMRDHSDPKLRLSMNKWQKEIDKFSARDQISFPIALRNFPKEKIFLLKKDQFRKMVNINSHNKFTSEYKPKNLYEKFTINFNKLIYFALTNSLITKIKKIFKE